MQAVTTIGLDIAKPVFQVHGIDAEGEVLIGLDPDQIGHVLELCKGQLV